MTQLQIVEREIAKKGKCYVICTAYDVADFDATLSAACSRAAALGAHSLYFAMRDEGHPLKEAAYTLGGYAFMFDTSFVILKKELAQAEACITPTCMKALRAGNAALFRDIYNESFFSIPNSQTMDDAEMEAIRSDAKRSAGFFMEGGNPIGVFALDYRGDVPEIAALAIRPEYRRQGYGRRLLHILEARLQSEGHGAAQLLVAESNPAAYALYDACGYRFVRRLSRWYRTEL